MQTVNRFIMMMLTVLLLSAMMLAGSACKANKPETKQAKEYFPSTMGSYWKYQGTGNEFASFRSEVVFGKANRVQLKENNGGTMIDSVYEISDTQVSRINYLPESYEKKNYLERPANQRIVLLKLPLEPGQSWENANDKREIVSVNANVDSPAGKFDHCIKIKISPQSMSSTAITYEYYRQGVGLVKRQFTSGNDTVSSVLEEYQIK